MSFWKSLREIFSVSHEKPAEAAVEEKKPEPDIREPVLAIVRNVEENPRRWQVTQRYNDRTLVYTLLDKKRDISFSVEDNRIYSYRCSGHRYSAGANTEWMTKDEINFAVNELDRIYAERRIRYWAIRAERKDRVVKKQRQQFFEIYVEGV